MTGNVPNRDRWLIGMLRLISVTTFVAIVVVFFPRSWIVECHRMIGLGEFPEDPVVGYLARSTSLWYAIFGLFTWFVSCDVQKYALLIRCLGWTMVIQGLIYLGIDAAEGLPSWWIISEGPCCSALGISVLVLGSRGPVID